VAAAREAVAVGAARGHLTAPYDPVPLLDALLGDTAENRSSMAEDIAHGRPTEADAIVGAALREGAAAGVPTPVIASLAERLRGSTQAR
jgi:2-dehydropantoate 2-reductase